MAHGRRRFDHDQLHIGDDRPAEGRGVPPSRRVFERPRDGARSPTDCGQCLPVAAADVSLQRMDFSLGVGRRRRPQYLPPPNRPAAAWRLFDEGVTHFCAAPTILITLANDAAAHRLERPVRLFTAGAPPSPTLIARMTALNFEIDHVYGLTETYGPFTITVPAPNLPDLPPEHG